MIDMNAILETFINPPPQEGLMKKFGKSKESIRVALLERADKSRMIKDLLKTPAWQQVLRPKIVESLKARIGKLIREGLTLSEAELKAEIADIRAYLSVVADMRYLVDDGDMAAEKLAKLEKTK